jgi:hypothetical protein
MEMTGNKLVGGWTRQDRVSEEAQAALDWVAGCCGPGRVRKGTWRVVDHVPIGLSRADEHSCGMLRVKRPAAGAPARTACPGGRQRRDK